MTKHNIWSISIISILFALLFTPLIVASSLYFPYVTGKVFAFRIGASILLILWLILVLINPQYLPRKNSIITISGIFVIWLGIANNFGVDPMNSYFSNFERMEGWFTHVYLFIYVLVLSSVLRTEKMWNWFLGTSVVVANYLALRAVFDTESRTQVLLGNSTYVAVYVLFNLFFAGILLYRLSKTKIHEKASKYAGILYYISSIILFTYVIFKTQTRGTVLALVCSLIVFLILSALSYWKHKQVRILSIILVLCVVFGSVMFWMNRDAMFIKNNPLLNRIATISATEGTGKARLMNWGIAYEGIKAHPIIGWGQENYSYVFAQKYDPRMYAQEPWFDRTHNAFLDWTIQGGIPALILYVLIFGSALWVIKNSSSLTRVEKNILTSLLIAYAIHNMFVFDNYSSYLMFFTTLGFIIHHGSKKIYEIEWSEKIKQLCVVTLIAIVLSVSFFTIIKPIRAASDLIDTLSQRDANKVLTIYKNIFNAHSFGDTEAGIRLLAEAPNFMDVDNDEFKKEYLTLATTIGESLFKNTQDVRRLETYGSFLLQRGEIKKSIEILEKAQTLAPNRHNNLYALGIAYIQNKEIQKAKEVFKHAYEILPENQKAKTYYGAVLLMSGDKSGKELIEGYSYKDPFFLSVFGKTQQYKEIIKIREQLKIDNPEDYQNQVSLAVAYVLDKQPAKAIILIREVQKVVPEFKGQGDALIRDIQAGKTIGKQ